MTLPLNAAFVHKWVDEKGITHYSDEAPSAAPTTAVTRIELPDNHSTARIPPGGYYSIANQWRRLHRERLERDRLALERQQQRAARTPAAPEVVYVESPRKTVYRVAYPVFRHGRHGHHRSHYRSGRLYGQGYSKRKHGIRRAGKRVDSTSLLYYRQFQ